MQADKRCAAVPLGRRDLERSSRSGRANSELRNIATAPEARMAHTHHAMYLADMKAAVLVKKGDPHQAFEIREVEKPEPQAGTLRIKVEAFGLNYADVMARLGLYQDAPPMPSILGYEVVGVVETLGDGVDAAWLGKRVVALTRFGGYAEYAVTDVRAAAEIGEMDAAEATALATQYATAWFGAEVQGAPLAGSTVLLTAAAGGVGTALIQLSKRRDCTVIGAASSKEKLNYLREQGCDHVINYKEQDLFAEAKRIAGDRGIDVIHDSVGGSYVGKGMKLINHGGRVVCYGAASMSQANVFQKLAILKGFGLLSPIQLMMQSKGIIGVNMLRVADHAPEVLQHCIQSVVALAQAGEIKPTVGGVFAFEDIAQAHALLGSRQSIGKIAITI